MRIHNRWFQLSAAAIAMVMIANLQYSWTLFVEPLRQSTGWKLSDIQWAFTLFVVIPTMLQPLQGWLIDRMGPRLFFSIAGVLCGIGWSTLGYVSTLPRFLTWGEVFSLFPAILGDYFGARHATSNYGVLYSAKGVAAIIGGGIAALLYEQFESWSACFYGSAALALLASVLAFGLRPAAAPPQGAEALYQGGTPLTRAISIT